MAHNVCQIENNETNTDALSLKLNYSHNTSLILFIIIKLLIILRQS